MKLAGFVRGSTTRSIAWDHVNFPIVRIGKDAVAANPTQVDVSNLTIVGRTAGEGTGLLVERSQGLAIGRNHFINLEKGFELLDKADLVHVEPTNTFSGVTTPAWIPAYSASGSTRAIQADAIRNPATIAHATNLLTHFGTNPQAELTLTTAVARNFSAPSGGRSGESYRIIIRKTNASASIGTWNAAFVFPGTTGPTLADMPTTQVWVGTFYCDGTNYICTDRSDGVGIPRQLSATATLNFASIAAGASADLTVTVTGAVVGDAVHLGLPAAINAGLTFTAFVSAANTVTVRATNVTGGAIDPASATFRAVVMGVY